MALIGLQKFFQMKENFQFVGSELPFGNLSTVLSVIAVYLVVIFGVQELMRDRKKFDLPLLVPIHNFFLCSLSFAMLIGMMYDVYNTFAAHGYEVETLICDSKKRLATGGQTWWFYIFFLSKFYELLDTVIIVLKKRPVIFLHVYHHCITVLLVYVMLANEVGVQWISSCANVMVHVPMYFYYALSSMGFSVWWKKYITQMQILQFVVDLLANSVGLYYHLTYRTCSGALWSWLFGQAVLVSFLILFIAFFKRSYAERQAELKKDIHASNGNGKAKKAN